MGITGQLPEHMLKRMSKKDRKPLGKAGVTANEAAEKQAVRFERDLHTGFIQWLKLHRLPYIHAAMCRKSTIQRGWPDFTVVYGRGVCCVEFKAPGGRLSDDQEAVLEQLQRIQTPVIVTDELSQAIRFTARMLDIQEVAA